VPAQPVPVDVSTDGDVIIVTSIRRNRLAAKLAAAPEDINARYAGSSSGAPSSVGDPSS